MESTTKSLTYSSSLYFVTNSSAFSVTSLAILGSYFLELSVISLKDNHLLCVSLSILLILYELKGVWRTGLGGQSLSSMLAMSSIYIVIDMTWTVYRRHQFNPILRRELLSLHLFSHQLIFVVIQEVTLSYL